MSEGRGLHDWNQTSLIGAILINANRDPKKRRATKPEELNPYARLVRREKSSNAIPLSDMGVLREAFEKMGKQRKGS